MACDWLLPPPLRFVHFRCNDIHDATPPMLAVNTMNYAVLWRMDNPVG